MTKRTQPIVAFYYPRSNKRKYTSVGHRKPSKKAAKTAMRKLMTNVVKALALVILGTALFALLVYTVMQGV